MATVPFVTPYVRTIRPEEADNIRRLGKDTYYWTGWTRRLWPWRAVREEDLVYAFDKKSRRLRALMRVTRVAAFEYRNWRGFSRAVEDGTGWLPRKGDHPIPDAGYGFAHRWEFVKAVDIDPKIGRFPQIGWLRLTRAAPPAPLIREVPLSSARNKSVKVIARAHAATLGRHDSFIRSFLHAHRLRVEDSTRLAQGAIAADLFLPPARALPGILVEAKTRGTDSDVRSAVGQLADYCWSLVLPRFGKREARRALRVIVAGSRPRKDLLSGLDREGIAVFWHERSGWRMTHSEAARIARKGLLARAR
jgi:hypothetical protein